MKNRRLVDDDDVAGKAIAAGGYGCVFRPPLKCADDQALIDSRPYVTKLMSKHLAWDEMREVNTFLPIIKTIPNYKNYFLLDGIFLSDTFDPLSDEDKINFDIKCANFQHADITADNVNDRLDELSAIYIPDGGKTVSSIMKFSARFHKNDKIREEFGFVVKGLIKTLTGAIVPLNKKNIIHNDLKGGNMLFEDDGLSAAPNIKLIDWGLAMKISKDYDINRWAPLQYNAPFSIILLTTHTIFLVDDIAPRRFINNEINLIDIKTIADELINNSQQENEGHMRYITAIFDKIVEPPFNNLGISIKESFVLEYITDVLSNFLRLVKKEGKKYYTFDKTKYFNEVYRHNCDIYGMLSCFVDYIMSVPSNVYLESAISQKITAILYKYCYSTEYASKRIPIKAVLYDLNELVSIAGGPPSKQDSGKKYVMADPRIDFGIRSVTNKSRTPKSHARKIRTQTPRFKKSSVKTIKIRSETPSHAKVRLIRSGSSASMRPSSMSLPKERKRCPRGYLMNKKTRRCVRK